MPQNSTTFQRLANGYVAHRFQLCSSLSNIRLRLKPGVWCPGIDLSAIDPNTPSLRDQIQRAREKIIQTHQTEFEQSAIGPQNGDIVLRRKKINVPYVDKPCIKTKTLLLIRQLWNYANKSHVVWFMVNLDSFAWGSGEVYVKLANIYSGLLQAQKREPLITVDSPSPSPLCVYVNDEPESKFLYTLTIKLYCICSISALLRLWSVGAHAISVYSTMETSHRGLAVYW